MEVELLRRVGTLSWRGMVLDSPPTYRYHPTKNFASSMTNHFVIDAGGDRWRERLGELGAPTLVVHGTEDPVFPYGNAVALEKEIPGARLLALEQVGHEVPPRALWDVVVPAILRHTSSAPRADHDPKGSPMQTSD